MTVEEMQEWGSNLLEFEEYPLQPNVDRAMNRLIAAFNGLVNEAITVHLETEDWEDQEVLHRVWGIRYRDSPIRYATFDGFPILAYTAVKWEGVHPDLSSKFYFKYLMFPHGSRHTTEGDPIPIH